MSAGRDLGTVERGEGKGRGGVKSHMMATLTSKYRGRPADT